MFFEIEKAGTVTIPHMKGYRELTCYSDLSSFGRRDRYTKIVVTIPESLLKKVDDKLVLRDWRPYEESFSTELARRIAPKWRSRSYGIIPGNFLFKEGTFHFIGESKPFSKQSDSVLFYADGMMKGYAGPKGATTFRFGDSEFYGIVLPLGSIMPHRSIQYLRECMEMDLKRYLAI
ncbi:hypothetical protein IJH15_00520 [Candidatus Saccharibacteria bacterium]|nr:hypothetical protein [Candidatus Saccharibacteria bacterium]MBR3253108.1 hypothetical protein [Candidatus Saccharibacteria bacterium]